MLGKNILSGGTTVVYSLFIAAPMVSVCSVFHLCFVMQYIVYLLVLQSSWWVVYLNCLPNVL